MKQRNNETTKHFILVTISLVILNLTSNAQLKVNIDGKIGIGSNPFFHKSLNVDGDIKTDGQIQLDGRNDVVMNDWSMDMNGGKFVFLYDGGVYPTLTLGDEKVGVNLPYYSIPPYYALEVNGTISCNNLVQSNADIRMKTDTSKIGVQFKQLKKLRAISFKQAPYKIPMPENAPSDSLGTGGEDSLRTQKDSIVIEPEDDRIHYGFVAGELDNIFPELVYEDKNGYKSINYIELIPILFKMVKKQQGQINFGKELSDRTKKQINSQMQQITSLEERVNNLQQLVDKLTDEIRYLKERCSNESNKESSTQSSKKNNSSKASEPSRLYQNTPNPFSENTQIRYFLPEQTTSATLYIYNMQGNQVDSQPVYELGNGTITIEGGMLTPGMYMYSLIADGKEVDTKKMILTR